ncbi:hypothetical protein AB0395_09950 [Streptosporangium sp. NPDC051023]|uniref:hypothetical protein n=1 Tax=Streptosporangium sp. NPDC051023 TaxID=3155410 RepID=UPI00344B031B
MTARRRTSTSTLLAGWLFADLLLGVTIIMLGAQAPASPQARPVADVGQPTTDATQTMTDVGQPTAAVAQTMTDVGQPTAAVAQPTADGARPLRETVRSLPDPVQPSPDAARPSPSPGRSSPTPVRSSPDAAHPLPSTTKPSAEKSSKPARPTSSTGSSRRPSPTPSPCVSRLGDVQAKPITISFQLAPGMGDDALAVQVRQELLRRRDQLAGRHAGMVLTFGADGGAGNGVRLATRVNTAIRETYPRIFGAAVTRNFHDLAAPPGSISMEIYLMTYGCSPTPDRSGS